MQSAKYYLKKAEESRRQAEFASEPIAKEYWQRLAREWLALAAATEAETEEPFPPLLPKGN